MILTVLYVYVCLGIVLWLPLSYIMWTQTDPYVRGPFWSSAASVVRSDPWWSWAFEVLAWPWLIWVILSWRRKRHVKG